MKKPEIPIDEKDRLEALESYRILDTPPEQRFDDLTFLASHICETPIALISLVDTDRQWFKSRVGLDAEQTNRDLAFCAHAIHDQKLFVVNDTLDDKRFADNPLVKEDPSIRFYVGAPLVVPEGHALGTICVIDREPRELNAHQSQALEALARQVVSQLELRKKIDELERAGEALLEAKEAAEAANRTKSKFLAYMSHELRTPLNAIIGFSNVLRKEPLGKKGANYLERIFVNGKHLLNLINNILDLSRIEANKMTIQPELFDAGEFVTEVASQVESLVESRDNTLEVRGAEGLGTLNADRTQLNQCLLNLLSNACKFTENGRIVLTAARRSEEGRQWFCLEVADSGIGIDPAQQLKLFDEFSRVDMRHTGAEGTGLGLTITRKICRLMGGDVTVRSEPGEGSTFTIRLPTEDAA